MKGTNKKHHARCQALEGKIGADARCSIYSLRPSPCRAFTASYEDGRQNPRCDQARARYGFAPLKLKDWLSFQNSARLSASDSSCYAFPHEETNEAPPPSSLP